MMMLQGNAMQARAKVMIAVMQEAAAAEAKVQESKPFQFLPILKGETEAKFKILVLMVSLRRRTMGTSKEV